MVTAAMTTRLLLLLRHTFFHAIDQIIIVYLF
jgi:hypothetical protein